MPVIYSMLSNDRSFPVYKEVEANGKKVQRRSYESAILIKGGANVADKHYSTQKFVTTEVSADDLKSLEANASFNRLVKRGFLSKSKPSDTKKDGAAPKTEQELKSKAGKKGVDVKLNTEQAEL